MSTITHTTLLLLIIFLQFASPSLSITPHRSLMQQRNSSSSSSPCPLDFDVLRRMVEQSSSRPTLNTTTKCQYILKGLRLVQSDYLRRTDFFLPPPSSAESCWDNYQGMVNDFIPGFDIRHSCAFETSWISQGCMNITTKSEFESNVSKSAIAKVVSACNQSLENNSPCGTCTSSLSSFASYLTGPSIGNVSDCTAYPSIYAAAFANRFGPTDRGTAKCLFSLDVDLPTSSGHGKKKVVIPIVVCLCVLILAGVIIAYLWLKRRRNKKSVKKRKRNQSQSYPGSDLGTALESISSSTTLINFRLDEIKSATKNFSRANIIGMGGYGNVYKGVLPDGSEVASKRFKNCSVAGDASFAHEVGIIASVRHVNLVALRGYCIATTSSEGHHRIIVCDLMKNGSLHDHLFGTKSKKLSWPIRQKVALGMARGLAYLHYGAQPAIIHRDIKASNILLDDNFEAKVADFGLARFTPEGATHISTRVAGTMGYVAPEYALYGQLSERSDVYSFGVVLLELLSGKKAIIAFNEGQPTLVADWAWALVREGRALDVIEDNMPELGSPALMEKYVLVAVLCSHPQLLARPTMDKVVKMLESDVPVPMIPERPVPLIAGIEDIERSVSSSGSGHLSTSAGYQPYTYEGKTPKAPKDDGEDSASKLNSG